MHRSLATLVFLFLITPSTQAASPSLGALRPVGGQRGTELEITLSGARLGDAQEIIYYQPGNPPGLPRAVALPRHSLRA